VRYSEGGEGILLQRRVLHGTDKQTPVPPRRTAPLSPHRDGPTDLLDSRTLAPSSAIEVSFKIGFCETVKLIHSIENYVGYLKLVLEEQISNGYISNTWRISSNKMPV